MAHLNADMTTVDNQAALVNQDGIFKKPYPVNKEAIEGIQPKADVNCNTFEDREFYEAQVKFLNSIIFDLKNKNDILNSRVEQLESYELPENRYQVLVLN